MFIIKVSPDSRMRQQAQWQKGEEERHMAPSPVPCWQAASLQAPFSLSSLRAADCNGPTSPSVSQARAPNNVAAMQLRRGREWEEEEEGEILTTNNHNAIHNALSPQDYMVYFQWGLAHPSQAFIGPFFVV